MDIFFASFLYCTTKRHKKLSKGTRLESFAYWEYAVLRARVRKSN
ncbi:hypothetical protein HMPREF9151_00995 [Hoylesella saccharolytica F0055]|uniref:Uncharacterized protein n=1 Tax=Hoylesella saccharolytica F0055 TaxID=1127699 RepID=L1NE07_9BACT|nr:hypothetical protein HMPREF9151_00995 [Hoylesella saccharolytica F0055]